MQYPVELNVQYSEKLSRLTTFFRFIMIIPHIFVLYFPHRQISAVQRRSLDYCSSGAAAT
jgi:hypothetical protein